MEMFALQPSDYERVYGGEDRTYTTTYYDDNGSGGLDQGDRIVSVEVYGQVMTPQEAGLNPFFDGASFFETVGGWFDNPWTPIGAGVDYISGLWNSLEGDEYIDWKTGGWHDPSYFDEPELEDDAETVAPQGD